jgi:hypothetical protein
VILITRKQAILAIMALPLAGFRRDASASRLKPDAATLTVDLDSWREVVVRLKGREVVLSAEDIFTALGGR